MLLKASGWGECECWQCGVCDSMQVCFCLMISFAKHYTLCCCHTDKPQVHIQMTYPLQGLTREGDALELTCEAIGKPQ